MRHCVGFCPINLVGSIRIVIALVSIHMYKVGGGGGKEGGD